ncbi:MAG TPA: hypothetical protein VJ946_04430 [Bacteroidales bacterium]|nr:hypothetical protein [Bacteroidales bacterium]
MQTQINELNSKMDEVLSYISEQRARSMATDDLVSDLSIVGKDMYDTAVLELDKQQVDIEPDEVKKLLIKFLRNIDTFTQLLDSLESVTDLLQDASPLVTEAIIDFSKYLQKLNERGLFEVSGALLKSFTSVLEKADPDAIRKLGENGDLMASIGRKLTDRELLEQTDNMLSALAETSKQEIKPASPMKLLFGSNRKEMKKATGFLLQFMNNMNQKK